MRPQRSCVALLVIRYALAYQLMSSRAWNSLEMRGTAVPMMVRSYTCNH